MPRIRTVKPEFFRHEELQDLGAEAMLVFAGLWTQCDSKGRFLWKPRQLKLDILPFMKFDMGSVLEKLREAGFLIKYEVDGKAYGCVPTFSEHQRITGKEATEGEKYPEPPEPIQGNNGEITETQQGNIQSFTNVQERERERDILCVSEFEQFWKAYPKRSGSKKAALDNWKKLNGQKPELAVILTAIKAQIEWRQNANGEFRPEWKDPERWIKNRMWEAETTAGAAKTKPKPKRPPSLEEQEAAFQRDWKPEEVGAS